MANYGGFYKGDKKKPKKKELESLAQKAEDQPSWSAGSTFTLPEIIPKGKSKDAQ